MLQGSMLRQQQFSALRKCFKSTGNPLVSIIGQRSVAPVQHVRCAQTVQLDQKLVSAKAPHFL